MPYFSSFDTCEEKSKEAVSFRVGNSKCQWFCIFQWNCWPREFAWQNRTFWRSASEGEANFLVEKGMELFEAKIGPWNPRSARMFCLTFPWAVPGQLRSLCAKWAISELLARYSTNTSIPWFEKTFCETEESALFAVFFNYNYCK